MLLNSNLIALHVAITFIHFSFSLLPVSQMNETSVTVEIQHDENVHWGPCTASDAPCKVSM